MTDTTDRVRAHYNGPGLVDRIKAALAPIADEDEALTVTQLAMLDQFHTRGILATADLAGTAGLTAADNVLDAGCGIGGRARYLASMFGSVRRLVPWRVFLIASPLAMPLGKLPDWTQPWD